MFKIEIPRKHMSKVTKQNTVKMYFDVNIITDDSVIRANGFRLVEQEGKNFIGFPSTAGKDGKRYPTFIPSKNMTDAIQVVAEQEYHNEGTSSNSESSSLMRQNHANDK